MITPPDRAPSDLPHKETPSDPNNAPDLATVDVAREDANRAAVEMRGIAAPVQSAASAINDTDNPIALVDFISSFLKTLSSFNSVVDKIATVRSAVPARPVRSSHPQIHPYVQAAWTVLSFASKVRRYTFPDDTI